MYRPVAAAHNIHNSVGETGLKLIFAAIIGVGIVAYVAYMMEQQNLDKSMLWPTTQGTLNEIGSQGASMPIIGRYLPIACPFAKYTYTVNGVSHTGEQQAGPCLSPVRMFAFTPPARTVEDQKDIQQKVEADMRAAMARGTSALEAQRQSFKKSFEDLLVPKYAPVKVRYEKAHPENSVLDPEVLQSGKSQLYTSIILMATGALLLGATFLHGYVTAPNPDDPALSLDAALKHQKRRY
jgi:hypothetical protein